MVIIYMMSTPFFALNLDSRVYLVCVREYMCVFFTIIKLNVISSLVVYPCLVDVENLVEEVQKCLRTAFDLASTVPLLLGQRAPQKHLDKPQNTCNKFQHVFQIFCNILEHFKTFRNIL